MNPKTQIAAIAVICLVIGVGAGYYGRGLIRNSQQATRFNGQQRPNGTGQFGGLRSLNGGGRPVIGQIQNVTADHLSIKMIDGSSKVILLTSDTKYHKITDATASDFTSGSQVIITGKEESDGSITANSIQAAPTTNQNTISPSPSASPIIN